MNCSSTTESVKAFLLDTLLNTYLNTSIFWDLLTFYIMVQRDPFLTFLNLSLDRLIFSPPKPLSHSKLLPQGFFKVFLSFSSLGVFLISHFHAFHVLKPRFWGFWKNLGFFKIDEFLLKFGMGFYLNEFKISWTASHKHYNSIIMHLDVCKLIVCW